MMTDKCDQDLLERLAHGNQVDLGLIRSTQALLRQIETAGVTTRHEYAIDRPLGRLVQVGVTGTLANADGLSQR